MLGKAQCCTLAQASAARNTPKHAAAFIHQNNSSVFCLSLWLRDNTARAHNPTLLSSAVFGALDLGVASRNTNRNNQLAIIKQEDFGRGKQQLAKHSFLNSVTCVRVDPLDRSLVGFRSITDASESYAKSRPCSHLPRACTVHCCLGCCNRCKQLELRATLWQLQAVRA